MNFITDKMNVEDWDEVASIYREGITTGNATFETNVPEYEAWDNSHHQHCRLVARAGDKVIGWAALTLFLKGASILVLLNLASMSHAQQGAVV
jgi:L-amino acid N-acyltransferase YncA